MEWWRGKWRRLKAFKRKKREVSLLEEREPSNVSLSRSTSAKEGMALRLGRPPGMIVLDRPPSRAQSRDDQAAIDENGGAVKPATKPGEKKGDMKVEGESARTSTMSVDPKKESGEV
jgi:hypothetical protein